MTCSVLITRPRDDAAEFASLVESLGYRPIIEPLISIEYLSPPFSSAQVSALVATSAHALQSQCPPERKSIPLYVMGAASAGKAASLGYEKIISSDGDFDNLLHLIETDIAPGSKILYLRGETIRHDLKGRLSEHFVIDEHIVYRTRPIASLSEDVRNAFLSREIQIVTLFSAQTGSVFLKLIEDAGLGQALRDINLLSLSPAVLESVASLPWGAMGIAQKADRAGMIMALRALKKD